jgi:peptidoglycan hydrolase-like protein with peptidoglycan-binding domain
MTPPSSAPLARALALGATLAAGAGGCAHTHAPPPPAAAVPATKPDHEQTADTGIPVASTPQGLMRDGAETKIQQRLRARSLLRAEQCNGQLDGDTQQALRAFQKSEGLPTTGLPSYETVDHLGLSLDAIFHTTPHPTEPVRAEATPPAKGSNAKTP